jgi:hypothetical protein
MNNGTNFGFIAYSLVYFSLLIGYIMSDVEIMWLFIIVILLIAFFIWVAVNLFIIFY